MDVGHIPKRLICETEGNKKFPKKTNREKMGRFIFFSAEYRTIRFGQNPAKVNDYIFFPK